MAVIGSVH